MFINRIARYSQYFLLAMLLFGLIGSQAVFAADEPKPELISAPTESLQLECKFPVLSGAATDIFQADVDIKYMGVGRKRFDIKLTTPKDWLAYAQSSYPEKQIAALELGPAEGYPVTEKITVKFAPIYLDVAEPGEHVTTLEVSSGALKASINLTAKIDAKYNLTITTETGKLNTQATAGRDSRYTLKLVNGGTTALENITFSADKPEGWSVKFEPEKVESIDAALDKSVDVVIKAPESKTIAGDYMLTIKAESKNAKANADIRVTVLTPSIWGWVGIAIVVVVIAALALIFWRLGRR